MPDPDLRNKPYGFVPLPAEFNDEETVWHDGTTSAGKFSGEIRFELKNLTPMLVGWERRTAERTDPADPWNFPSSVVPQADAEALAKRAATDVYPSPKKDWDQPQVDAQRKAFVEKMRGNVVENGALGTGAFFAGKSILVPLRLPDETGRVVIPGDTLKGLLRHELGALLGAPMERVAERSYSYRPNARHPSLPAGRFLIPRLARVVGAHVEERKLYKDGDVTVRVPTHLELLDENLRFERPENPRNRQPGAGAYMFDVAGGHAYRGGQGAGDLLNAKKKSLHSSVGMNSANPALLKAVPAGVIEGYLHTVRHLADDRHGHFSERHPDIGHRVASGKTLTGEAARARILQAASKEVFKSDDIVWVEWDETSKEIVSFGWHYYYRWAYQDTVRSRNRGANERDGLWPTQDEKQEIPVRLTAVRRLFGFCGDNEGSKGIGGDAKSDYAQLAGRVSVNAALEVLKPGEAERDRFLGPVFLQELGMPRPSAVEFYLRQPRHPRQRPSDRAKLVTYGDADSKHYDAPGELAGRKFYLDRRNLQRSDWEDASEANRLNERSTLALGASRENRTFRFTLRFRDLDAAEIVAMLVALCPNQFGNLLGGSHADGYCSKLGYARPLGWGTVQVEAKSLQVIEWNAGLASFSQHAPDDWFRSNAAGNSFPKLKEWLEIHRRNHPHATSYPRRDGTIPGFHTNLRSEHALDRRYRRTEP